jgi:hypothetical protein
MATFTKHADTTLAALLPYPPDQQNDQPRHLLMLQLPFCHDVPKLRLPALPSVVPSARQETCRQLIHAMAINHAKTSNIPNPAIRLFQQTILHRALHPSSSSLTTPITSKRPLLGEDGGERHEEALRNFSQALPIQKQQRQGGKTELYNPFEKWKTPDQV